MESDGRIAIENVWPQLECGKFSAKAVVGDKFTVKADIFTHGTDLISANLKFRPQGSAVWESIPMQLEDNDRWSGRFEIPTTGFYEYTIEAWVDKFATQSRNIASWIMGGESIDADLKVAISMLKDIATRCGSKDSAFIRKKIAAIGRSDPADVPHLLNDPGLLSIVRQYGEKKDLTTFSPVMRVSVDRVKAGFSSWYEIFPRSQGNKPGVSGTFRDCEKKLDYISSMGFDVLYLTPIHPIGITERRGKNGARKAMPGDPGSPWAIGNSFGGHDAINPDLGTMDDFIHLINVAKKKGLEIAMDLAFQCSPDHPYVKDHPEWFYHRPDGTIRYAENPPKKYYDIYPLNFDSPEKENLWKELKRVILFWIEKGVKIFRVDNPHTKPLDFWKWILNEVKKDHDDVIFLAEAFTRPKLMYELSKIGFSMSYTYFTWRNYDFEIREYFSELSSPELKSHFRPMIFTNTPDILPPILQKAGRPAFMFRSVLAATLSPLWGIYSGFEICENQAVPGTEEYLNSEKYEIRNRNFDEPGNIRELITKLNAIRRSEKALQSIGNVQFHQSDNPNIIFYTRQSNDGKEALMVAVNLNPDQVHSATVRVPLSLVGADESKPYKVRDLLTGDLYVWNGEYNYVRLIPGERPAHILKVER
ncbi:DUF3416 domain-containing protein [Oxyplasma meridianum]|uniref:Alpha-1,4-glucan:maltose-1-phosphate maltosyltransferase n=1 Tax=Oxyplasma meridianum TaxID=3073602 RepID=A0AAX4NE03_9ARCH